LTSLIRPRSIGGSSLVRDYLQEVPSASAFYSGSPYRLSSFREKLPEVEKRFGLADRARAAAALRPVSEVARARLERFVAEGGFMVTTGQQAGFLTGPLYTIYKALSAVLLARDLEERLGVLVLPVFWVASEDHDWAEANHAFMLDGKGRVRRYELSGNDSRALPMSEWPLGPSVEKISEEIVQVIAPQGVGADWVRRIIDPYRDPKRTVGEAFGMAIGELLSEFDIFVADAADPELKAASAPVLIRALEEAEDHERRLTARSEALTGAGYKSQVSILEGGTNVFAHGERGRERLYRAPGGYVVRERAPIQAGDEVRRRVEDEPGRFSPNVLLRPVVESTVFPTIAYVGGPGEIAYFAQVGALFEAYGIRPPVIVPRFSATVVEGAIARLMEKLELEGSDLEEGREVLRDRFARREIPPAVTESLETLRRDVASGYEALVEAGSEVDTTLVGALAAIRNRNLAILGEAERRVLRATKRRDLIVFQQLDRVLDALMPTGAPQDRVLNVLPFLARYGEHFLKEVVRSAEGAWRRPG
jgi:bacillithiol synthase